MSSSPPEPDDPTAEWEPPDPPSTVEWEPLDPDRTTEFCPPFPPSPAAAPLTFDPRWRTETVVALARGIDADAAYDRLPILADALEEAGCEHTSLLHHCRTCPHPFACCWVVNVILDRVPGELPAVPTALDPVPVSPGPCPAPRPRLGTRINSWGGWVNVSRAIVILAVAVSLFRLFTTVFIGTPSPAVPRVNPPTVPTGRP